MNDTESTWVPIFSSRSRRACRERALVLAAANIDYELFRRRGEIGLAVDPADAARARDELEAYTREERAWQQSVPVVPNLSDGWNGALIYAIVIIVVGLLDQHHAWGYDWRSAGRLNAGAVQHGEWWRTLTALSLHLNLLHLAANVVFGILFGLFVGQLLGSGLAWLSILLAGALGNGVNALLQPPEHNAIGASTAIFAALGLLCTFTWKHRRRTERRWFRRLLPIVGGVALLGFTGAGGENTDVAAHLAGFVAGLALGAIYSPIADRLRFRSKVQLACGAAAIIILAGAWFVALRAT